MMGDLGQPLPTSEKAAAERGSTRPLLQLHFPSQRDYSAEMVVQQKEDLVQDNENDDRISQNSTLQGSTNNFRYDRQDSHHRIDPGNANEIHNENGRIPGESSQISQDLNGRIVQDDLQPYDNQPVCESNGRIAEASLSPDKALTSGCDGRIPQDTRLVQDATTEKENSLLQDNAFLLDGNLSKNDSDVTFDVNVRVTASSIQLLENGGGQKEAREEREEVVGERQTWDKKLDFLLAIIGFAIDLGNVWRFPYICYKNGGGAFLIPYLTMLVFLGLPLFYMELALGQFHRQGPITIWRRICPMFCGVGYAICVVATFVGAYYNTIIAWAVYYLIMSLRSPLVYSSCDNDWNTPQCAEPADGANRTNASVSSVEEFFKYHVLESHKSTGIDDLGNVRWQLFLCLLVVFIIVFFCCWKGTKSTGKAVWVTATLPFIVLAVLLVRGVTLPGAGTGIIYYLKPDFNRLGTLEVWVDAAAQIFFSLGPGFGALIALSSYNKFYNNCFRDAVLTSSVNCFTSFLAGIVVFAVLGYMAHVQGTTVEAVATHGPGLVFVVYAEAISTLGGSVFWAIIFFLMLITLGLDSTFGGLEGVMTALADEFSFFRSRRTLVVASVCCYCFLTGLPTVTYGGTYFIYLMDTHAAPISLLFICFVEVIAVNWFYGARRFADDIKDMLGSRPSVFWLICWSVVCPTGLLLLFSLSFIGYERLALDGYVYPWWAELVGWMVTLVSIVCIPGYVIWSFFASHGSLREKWRQMITPEVLETSHNHQHNGQVVVEYGAIYKRHTAIQL